MTNLKTLQPADLLAGAELGDLIRFSDGTPQPPARFTKKLAEWRNRNGTGRLSARAPDSRYPSFTLHLGDFAAAGTVVLRSYRTFEPTSSATFTLEQRAPVGSLICCRRSAGGLEVYEVTSDPHRAREWLGRNPGGVILRVEPDDSRSPLADGLQTAA